MTVEPTAISPNLSPYAGRWIALWRGQVAGQGGTPDQARAAARAAHFKEKLQIIYVNTEKELAFYPLLERVRTVIPEGLSLYLVGGAVRDAIMGRPTHDLDFVLSGDALGIARQVANRIGAAYYPLDEERGSARLVIITEEGERQYLDFSTMRGPDLESDLRARDFTINAIAVDIHRPQELFDPLGGAVDVHAKILRPCSPSAFVDDPVRILRAVRFAASLNFHILRESRQLMRQAVPSLPKISVERLRDEIFHILDGRRLSASIRALDMLGALPHLFPEILTMKEVEQSPPHVSNVWLHTLEVLNKLETLLDALAEQYIPDKAANLLLGLVTLRIGRFRQQINTHYHETLVPDRSLKALTFLAALYHDAGKPLTHQVDENGVIHFIDHERLSARLASERATWLHLSNVEQSRLEIVVRHHLRPILLSNLGKMPSRKAIYRFFRDTGKAGVEICLLSMADCWATYGISIPIQVWETHLNVVRTLFEAWWEHPQESVTPPVLLNGNELMNELNIAPGPVVGRIIEAIREAQAVGNVRNRSEAITLAKTLMS